MAWQLWMACVLYFGSSVFFVKMLLAAARVKGMWEACVRWRIARDNVLYHLLLLALVPLLAAWLRGADPLLVLAAYLPALLRGFRGAATLSNRLPPLHWVGLGETFSALWFTGCLLAALLVGR